jgi:hypothetical protein
MKTEWWTERLSESGHRRVWLPYAEYPYKGTDADLERLREKFHDKITAILASVNRENAVAGTLTLGEFIERSYFSRLDWRLNVPAGTSCASSLPQ